MNETTKLSVFMMVYNHEKYIAQALDSVLMQKVDFKYEIVLGEDCSTDSTRKIVVKYAQRYPSKFKLLLHKTNIGVVNNQNEVFKNCTGKYIAVLEGDDYWTDPLKLQKQVDFLEANSEFSACAHQSELVFQDSTRESRVFRKNVPSKIQLKDVIEERLFHTASIIFKTEIMHNQSLPSNIISGDRALYILCATNGPIKFLEDSMCVYRKNEKGLSSNITSNKMLLDLNMIPWIKKMNMDFPSYRLKSFIYFTALNYPKNLTVREFVVNYLNFVIYSFSYFPKNLYKIAWLTFKSFPRDILPKFKK
jgi:glycosyltransferase involved in cell wall biosynthesis